MSTAIPTSFRRALPSRLLAAALAAGTLATVAGCARNPVTGRNELALVSQAQEIQIGQQGAQEVVASIGLVQNDGLQQYVGRVGAALAAKSERPDLPWSFRVVDDPTPNAFALPGGPIFVTRGLLGLMDSEAELAAVLGHEIGHITARHSVSQMSRAQLAQIGLGVGAILSPQIARYGELAGTGLQLLFLKYGRDDERQSDDLGFKYALGTGYDVREMDDVFAALQRVGEASGQSPLPSWMASHPDPGERIRRTQQRVAELGQVPANAKVGTTDYLNQIRGLVHGENPRNGFFQNGVFYHPDLRFRLTFPQGWRSQNTPQAVIAVSPQQDAALQLTLAGQAAPEQAARQFLSQQGIQPGQATRETINGVPAVASYFQAQTQQGVIQGLTAWFAYGGQTYQVLSYAPAQRFGAYDPVFRQVLGSFAPLTDPAALNVQPNRLEIVQVPQAMTLAQFVQRYPSPVPIEQLALINQLDGPNATIPAGTYVKRVVAGSGM